MVEGEIDRGIGGLEDKRDSFWDMEEGYLDVRFDSCF
jgi:hypothetical protein